MSDAFKQLTSDAELLLNHSSLDPLAAETISGLLRAVRAAWSEGHQAGWEDRHEDWLADFTPSGYTQDTPNPYEENQS